MLAKYIFAGFGGQGILLMGYALSYTAMRENKFTTFLPSYGAEVRGGTANCTIVISDEEIASPVASMPDIAVVLNTPSLLRFENVVRSGGMFLINTSLVKVNVRRQDVKHFGIPATEIAEELGNTKITNMVMLGAFIKKTKIISLTTLINSLKDILPEHQHKFIDINAQAIKKGYEYL